MKIKTALDAVQSIDEVAMQYAAGGTTAEAGMASITVILADFEAAS